jgi:alpha/beta superfamily hydrolase
MERRRVLFPERSAGVATAGVAYHVRQACRRLKAVEFSRIGLEKTTMTEDEPDRKPPTGSRSVPRIETLSLAGPAGSLEAVFRVPAGAPARAALLCHPHPLYGGSMHNPVVFRAARALHRCGFATLRFNFRGVGRSTGSFDGGKGEREDARAALEALASRLPGLPITLLGYSFGAWVGFEAAAADSRVADLIGIGIPLTLWPFSFLKRTDKPVLVVQGSEDAFGPLPAVRRLVAELGPRARLAVVHGAGHSFEGELGRLEETLAAELRPAP